MAVLPRHLWDILYGYCALSLSLIKIFNKIHAALKITIENINDHSNSKKILFFFILFDLFWFFFLFCFVLFGLGFFFADGNYYLLKRFNRCKHHQYEKEIDIHDILKKRCFLKHL